MPDSQKYQFQNLSMQYKYVFSSLKFLGHTDRPQLQAKADELASRMDIDGWLSQFKSRRNISHKNVCSQSFDVNEDVSNIFGRRLPEFLSNVSAKRYF